jgi:hypothetical protein
MRHILSILFTVMMVAFISNQADAQSLMQTAKKAEQRAKELKQQETSRYNAIVDSKDLSKYNQFINDYPKGSKTPEIRKRAQEITLWNYSKTQNTIASYEHYLNTTQYHWYDNEANQSIRSIKQKVEKAKWDKVVAINTISGYQTYLQDNPTSGYKQDAEKAINRLQGQQAWNRIKNTENINELQNFISSYPCAAEVSIANAKLHELKGVQHYNEGNLGSAYSEFSNLTRDKISYANRKAYDDVMEYNEYSKLGHYATETALLNFMRKYPNSKYSNEVSNKIAVAKARNFGDYASSYDYNQALSYAKDSYTRNSVQSYISMNKKKQKERRNAMKSWERKQNGGTVNLGLDFLDLGLNEAYDDCPLWYYNVGLMLRFGNFKDRVQFAIGIKPGIFGYTEEVYSGDYYYDYDDTEKQTAFHMPIVGQLKLNLFKTSENSRFFIYGKYQYNAVRVEDIEAEMAWGAGLGIAWKHFDWAFYYRQDIGNVKNYDYRNQHYFGMSLIYYWQL